MHTRVGLVAGVIGAVLVFAAQVTSGLAALFLVGLVGLGAGLGVAKWLPRDWFGRQFAAGLRAGTLACALAASALLASLVIYGQHAIQPLAARSHLLALDLGPLVRALGFVGWAGLGLVGALVAFAIGTGLAAVAAQLAGWDKNREAILAVERAREAAQRSNRFTNVGAIRPSSARATSPSRSTPLGNRSTPLATSGSTNDMDLSGLSGLNESFHSMRSPISMVPPPEPAAAHAANGLPSAQDAPDVVPDTGYAMIDAASLLDLDPNATSAGMPLEPAPGTSGGDRRSAFIPWSEPEPEAAPSTPPAPPASPAVPEVATHRDDPQIPGAPREIEPLADDANADDELSTPVPRQRPDTDSWLC